MNKNFNAMKIIIFTFIALLLSISSYAQISVYKKGEHLATGVLINSTNSIMYIRVLNNNKPTKRAFFHSGIDSVVIRDSLTAIADEKALNKLSCPVIYQIERPVFYLSDLNTNQSIHLATGIEPRLDLRSTPEIIDDIKLNNHLAGRHLYDAGGSLILGIGVGIVATMIPSLILNSDGSNVQQVQVISVGLSLVSLGFTVQGCSKLMKAGKILIR
jgi:hypothetical protein